MRLIDADAFIKDLKSVTLSNGTLVNTNTAIALIDKYPTAYDIGKVVEELESEVERWEDSGKEYDDKCEIAVARGLRNAIEIVKHGGVTDDVCELERDEHSENDNPAEWIICPHKPKRIFSKDIKYCPYCGKKIKVVK